MRQARQPQNAWAGFETERLANDAAPWTSETSLPSGLFEIGSTGRAVRENALELRELQVVTGQDIHAKH